MSEDGGVGGPGVVLAAARRCGELDARGDVRSLLELLRVAEDLVVAAHVLQARVLSRLTVPEAVDFARSADEVPGSGR